MICIVDGRYSLTIGSGISVSGSSLLLHEQRNNNKIEINSATYFISVLIIIQITDRARKYCENIAVFSKVCRALYLCQKLRFMNTISINLNVPQGWHELDDDQLRYIYSLIAINDKSKNSLRTIFNINPKQKVTFKFLANEIPNPRTLFIIRGERYVCEKNNCDIHCKWNVTVIKRCVLPCFRNSINVNKCLIFTQT